MKKRGRKYLASITAVFILISMLPLNAKANTDRTRDVIAQELNESERLKELSIDHHQVLAEKLYTDDEIVTIIVEMDESPVMDYFETSTYSVDKDKTPGETVADFLSSIDTKATAKRIIANQEKVLSEISTLINKGVEEKLVTLKEFQVIDRWSTIVNAVAIQVPYGRLKEIKQIDGVRRAYVEHVYEEPEPIKNSIVEDGKENYEYSYEMVGVQDAWKDGYTGKKMMVAVLDSGIDIKMDWTQQVVREHEAFTDNSFKSGNPADGINDWELRHTNESIKEFLDKNQINANTGDNGNKLNFESNYPYKNLKVPFGWDYADKDYNVMNPYSDHGTHVSGTIAGFAASEEGKVKFSGVSPDAQLIFMKVFSDNGGGATETVLINALEDSLSLGADLINLSLGSNNGFADDDTLQNDLFHRVNKAGIVLMTSAGNSYKSTTGSSYNNQSLTSNPDESMVSSPSVYDSNLSVASIENTINAAPYFTWNDKNGVGQKVYFTDPWSVAMKADFGGIELPLYKVDGVGTYDDFYNVGFNNGYNNGKTGLALVKRGEISFADKVNNGMRFSGVNSQGERYGVLGVIIYDDNPDGTELININVDGTGIASAFISGKDGASLVKAIEDGHEIKMVVSEVDETIDNPQANQMSSFTSWGTTPGLEIKPEITAPGGNIWSSVLDKINTEYENYIGSYEMMSGTSMAAPHMSGIGTLVRERILQEEAFSGLSAEATADLINQLLVSTAMPIKDSRGIYYSVRQQGAGLVNAAAAISTPAYITVEDKKVGKIELGDDPEKTGNLSIEFNLNNISKESVKYNAEIVLMRTDITTIESTWGERNTLTDNNVVIKTYNLGEIIVSANETTSFSQVVSLTESEKAELNSLFENGNFIEGYVILTDATEKGNPQLGVPVLSYYGDWTKAPIYDSSLWFDEPLDGENVLNNEGTWGTSVVGSFLINEIYGIIGFLNLGQNIFDSTSVTSQLKYEKENLTLSPNGDGYFDIIDDYVLYQLRDAKVVIIEAKDAKSGELYMRQWTPYSSKSLYYPDLGAAIPSSVMYQYPTWDGTDLDGNILPSGTKVTYSITAYGEGEYGEKVFNEYAGRPVTDFDSIIPGENEPTFNGHKMDMTGDIISFPVTIDTAAPKLENNAVSIYERDGRTYLTGKVYEEDGSLASVEVVPIVTRSYKEGYGDPNYSDSGLDRNNPFYINNIYDAGSKELTFTADVTEYIRENESYPGESDYFDYKWTGNVVISCGDYGANDRSYAVKIDSTEGIVLSQTSALLNPGNKFTLSVNNNTNDTEAKLTRTSSNPEVATIDDTGLIQAMAPGQTIITVSNGTSSAICVVAVEERISKIEDFQLSIDKFSGLKQDCTALVKVTNVKPANADTSDINWEIIEDPEYVNQYGEGILRMTPYSGDALGMMLGTVGNGNEMLPAGKGQLRVTIGGIERTLDIDWEEIYNDPDRDDLVSNEYYGNQVNYIKQGESSILKAKYKQNSLHDIGNVETELTGLKLDGPDFYYGGTTYKATLINEEGYGLPEAIKIYTVYSDGTKVEYVNYPWYSSYTYNAETGEIELLYAPYGTENTLLIEAEGVISEGAPAGSLSDVEYEKPDGLMGPFNWTVTSGDGVLTISEANDNGSKYEVATFTPNSPGVSYITATTKDNKYSLNFAVISEPILADNITLGTNKVEIKTGETSKIEALLSPEPSLEKDTELIFKSFSPEVAKVSKDGVITGISEGYAYIKIESASNCKVTSYCIVKVTKAVSKYNVIFKDYDGTVLKEEVVEEGNGATAPENPIREGYKFIGWDKDFSDITDDLVVTAQYEKISNKFTVTFKDHDGTVLKEEVVEEGNGATAPENPIREGYKFIGWDKDFSDITENLVVTAQYEKISNKFTVTFKDHDGTILKEEVVEEGNGATAPENPVREGYKFIGWDKDFSNITDDLVVTARYEKISNKFTVTFKDHDGTVLKEEIVEKGNGATAPANPIREGYKFVGWNKEFSKVTKDLVIIAQYQKNNNNGSGNYLPQTGGTNRILPITLACILFLAGVTLLVKGKKKRV